MHVCIVRVRISTEDCDSDRVELICECFGSMDICLLVMDVEIGFGGHVQFSDG